MLTLESTYQYLNELIHFVRLIIVQIQCLIILVTRQRSWLRHYATSWKVAASSPNEVDFFNLPNPSSHTMVLESTQPLTEISTRNLPGGKGRLVHKAHNLTAICELTV
jgi:hypothetical protein